MAERQESSDSNDFEVLPRDNKKDDKFVSLNSATSSDGDPYEQRKDILQGKLALEKLKEQLNFGNEEVINEVHDKLKAREALDAQISNEISAFHDIASNDEWKSLKEVAIQAQDLVSKMKNLAAEKNTTLKRAQDVLDICLPSFLLACQLSRDEVELSPEYLELQDLYQQTKSEVLRFQQEFEMEKREEKVKEGQALLRRSISVASSEFERVDNLHTKEKESDHFAKFKQDEDHVNLMINAEMQEVTGWLKNCDVDLGKLKSTVEAQKELFSSATNDFNTHVRELDISLEINAGRQADLMKQLNELRTEEERLKKERVFQGKVQQRAKYVNAQCISELSSLQERIKDIKEHASTAEVIMQTIKECSQLLLTKSYQIQKGREAKLSELMMEALIRERNVMSAAAVEFKMFEEMTNGNLKEYTEATESIRKDISKAAAKGQGLTVSKKRQELEEYENELKRENEKLAEYKSNYVEIMVRLEQADERLQELGVSSVPIETLIEQQLAAASLGTSGPQSFLYT